jgi:uncharacterized phage protein (TIGR02216 family)
MDWSGLMRLGLHELRLTPREFWALTPMELLVMSGRDTGALPMTRDGLAALSRLYPDNRKGDGDG